MSLVMVGESLFMRENPSRKYEKWFGTLVLAYTVTVPTDRFSNAFLSAGILFDSPIFIVIEELKLCAFKQG